MGGECIRMNHGTLSTDRVSLCYSTDADHHHDSNRTPDRARRGRIVFLRRAFRRDHHRLVRQGGEAVLSDGQQRHNHKNMVSDGVDPGVVYVVRINMLCVKMGTELVRIKCLGGRGEQGVWRGVEGGRGEVGRWGGGGELEEGATTSSVPTLYLSRLSGPRIVVRFSLGHTGSG